MFLTMFVAFIFTFLLSVSAVRTADQCLTQCNDLRFDVLTMEICKEAKKQLPRPKVGDYCGIAMEQGFSDACIALCMDEEPQSHISQACRAAAMEMPRPTVRQWCEHGYSQGFSSTRKALATHFPKSE